MSLHIPEFFTSSGFADVCTHHGTRRREPSPRARRLKRRLNTVLGILLATGLGVALAAIVFIGLSGGFRS